MGHPFWPLFDLEVRTPRVTLRYVDDELAARVAALAEGGIHDPAFMPFATPWSDAPAGRLGRESMQFLWRCRAGLGVDEWHINLAVIADGQVVGASGLVAEKFPITRWFETGSWLGRDFQGQGFGTELRVATLHLGFVGLGAEAAGTAAFTDNGPSLGVTRKLGYEPNGIQVHERRGELGVTERFRMTRSHFDAHVRRDDIELVGVEPVRALLGIDD